MSNNVEAPPRKRVELYKIIMAIYRPFLQKFPGTNFAELLTTRYGVDEVRLMTVEQVEDLVWLMQDLLNGGDV